MRWLNGTELGSSPVAIWLEADVDKMGTKFHNAGALSELVEGKTYPSPGASSNLTPRFIHGLEAGYKGSLPVTLLLSALVIRCSTLDIMQRIRLPG